MLNPPPAPRPSSLAPRPSPLKIGLITACYAPVVNGVTRMVRLHKARLEALGHQVTVFTIGGNAANNEPNVFRSWGIPLGRTGYAGTLRYQKAAQIALREMDIVHCHHLIMGLEFAHRYARCPIVYTNHTRYDLYTHFIAHVPKKIATHLLHWAWPHFTNFADVVIAPTASIGALLQQFGVTRPIEVIANGIDLEDFGRSAQRDSHGDLVGVYVGRLSAEKNLPTLLSQFKIAHTKHPNLKLRLIGDGPARRGLRRQITQLALQDAIMLVGGVSYEGVVEELESADFFITASVSEVHPLTLIEALAAGLPILATNSPGIKELVQSGTNGLLSAPENLANSLIYLAENDQKRTAWACAAHTTSQAYSIDHTITATLALYHKLLSP